LAWLKIEGVNSNPFCFFFTYFVPQRILSMKTIETPIQIRFVDIDQFGHVNNAIYLTYLEISRIPYFDQIIGLIDWLNQGIILGKAEVEYKIPILLEDEIVVKTWCSRIGSKSFDLSYSLIKIEGRHETEVATAKTVMVCFDYINKVSIAVPEEWKQKMM
jgi:acyl-CoA thioester hydrolase